MLASYSACASVVFWGAEFAVTAAQQLFEVIDLRHNGEMTGERQHDVQRECDWLESTLRQVTDELAPGRGGLSRATLDRLRDHAV